MAVVILIIAAGFIAWRSGIFSPTHKHHNYPENFFVTSLDFGYTPGSNQSGQAISINFSQPVESGHVQDHFSMTPSFKGRFEKGSNETEVLFIPEYPFESGLSYIVTIKAGLPSMLGSELREDFVKTLSLDFGPDDYKILKNGRYALVQSISMYEPEALRTQIGMNIKAPSVKIFKASDPEAVIRDILSYPVASQYPPKLEFKTDLSKLTLVKDKTDVRHAAVLELPKEAGIYLIQAIDQDAIKSQVWVTVNTMGFHFRQDDQKFVVAGQDLKSGEPVSGVELKTYEVTDKDELKFLQKFSLTGITQFPLVYPKLISIAIAKKGDEVAFIPVNIKGTLAEIGVYQSLADLWQGFLYTERPIYKTADVVKYRGIVRKDNDGQFLMPPAGTQIILTINNDQGANVPQLPPQEATIDENGAFFGEFALSNVPAGNYTVSAATSGISGNLQGAYAWFEVKNYTKPDFELTASLNKEEYIEGDMVEVKFKGSNFNGKAFGKQKVTYTVYGQDYYETEKSVYNKSFNLNGWGGMCGGGFDPFGTYYGDPIEAAHEVTLGANGEISVSFDTKKLGRNISQQLTFVVEKKDQHGNVITDAQTAVVHNGEFNIFLRAFKNQSKQGSAPTAVFSAETLDGKKLSNQQFEYKFEKVRYEYKNNVNERIAETIYNAQVKTNSEGIGEFKVTGIDQLDSQSDSIEVSVQGRDARQNIVTASQGLYLFDTNNQYERPTLLDITSEKSNLIVGEKAKLKIVAPAKMKVLIAFERGRVYDPQWLDLKAGENTYEFTVKEQYRPSITPTFTAFYQNRYYSEGLTFNVPAMDKLLNISATTDKQEYSEGQVALVTIKVTDELGKPAAASLSLGIIDKAIFSLRKSTQLPIHSSFYFFRQRRTNNSSSMTGISFGEAAERGGGGGDSVPFSAKDVDVLYWNPDLNVDASGQITLEIPVLGNTVWKGVIYGATSGTDLGQTDFEFTTR